MADIRPRLILINIRRALVELFFTDALNSRAPNIALDGA